MMDEKELNLLDRLSASVRLDNGDRSRAMRAQSETGGRLSGILVNLGICLEEDVAEAIAHISETPRIALDEFPEEPVLDLQPEFLRAASLIPVDVDAARIVVAMSDPLDDEPVRALAFKYDRKIERRLARRSEIERVLDRYYPPVEAGHDSRAGEVSDLDDLERLRDLASEAPVVQRLNKILTAAISRGVSDVHIEAERSGASVRYRIDGTMQSEPELAAGLRDAILTRLKVISGLDLSERRLPQDGRAQIVEGGRTVDLRVATIPTLHGESAVIRILDRDTALRGLAELGFSDPDAAKLREWLSRPQGLICVTGPTGSGKTTTLYAALMEFDAKVRKIVSVEDPIEYQLAQVNQVQINSDIGFTFARALRSLLRHNPNVIMVGEIRDPETAQIAIQAAQTGHLVLATLHTNDAVSAVVRLVDMGVEPYLVSSTLTGVAAQRLVPTICQTCHGTGCSDCGTSGKRGRTALLEVLDITPDFRKAISKLKDGADLYAAAKRSGWRSLSERGKDVVAAGLATEQDVLSATLSNEV